MRNEPELYFSLVLFLESGLFGTFTAQNFIHWFVFWELSLIPAFFLIKFWGGPRRQRGAYQFFIYTMAGSVAMLAAFLAIYHAPPARLISANWRKLGSTANWRNAWSRLLDGLTRPACVAVFGGRLSGLGGESAAGALPHLAAGGLHRGADRHDDVIDRRDVENGRVRIPAHPAADFSRADARAANSRCCGWRWPRLFSRRRRRFAQKDLKRMVAYSSINHLGYCLLGIFAAVG